MIAPNLLYGTPPDSDLLSELRGLFSEYPCLARCGPETLRRMLRSRRGVEANLHAVEAALEALRVEGEVLP